MAIQYPETGINIKVLVLDSPEQRFTPPFDVEQEITYEDWDSLEKEIDYFAWRDDHWDEYSGLAPYMAMLFPNRIDNLKVDEKAKAGILNTIHKAHKRTSEVAMPANYFDELLALKVLFNIDVSQIEEGQTFYQENAEQLKRFGRQINFSRYATEMALLFPDKMGELNLDKSIYKEIKENLDSYQSGGHIEHIDYYLNAALALKVLFPNQFAAELGKLDWDRLKQYWQSRKEHTEHTDPMWIGYAKIGCHLKMLMASEIVNTSSNIDLSIASQTKSEGNPQIPENRRF